MYRYTIEYYIGTYEGTEIVCTDSGDAEDAIAIMWRRLKNLTSMSMAAKGAKVVSVEEAV